MATGTPEPFESVLRRMHHRDGVDSLATHLEASHGLRVAKLSRLDVGVFRVDRADPGPPLVARLFSAARSHSAAADDLAVLRHLAEMDFPAERPFGDQPLTTHESQALLLTEFVKEAPKAKRPPYPIVSLGATIGRLHGLPAPPGVDRAAGALHHFSEGTMRDELRAAAGWLDSIEGRLPGGGGAALGELRAALDTADGGEGLPEAFVHPDPVPKNAVFTADGPVLVDWTSAGVGPRLASLTLVLRSGWAALPFMKGYTRIVSITDQERGRLAGLLFSRQLIDVVFRVCRAPDTITGASKRLPRIRRDCEAKARDLL